MCIDGSCGSFDPTGFLRFTLLSTHRQPKIPGITLPPAGVFVDERGQPMLPPPNDKPATLYERFSGMFFSRGAAIAHLQTLRQPGVPGRGQRSIYRVEQEIRACTDLAELGGLEQAENDYVRPMIDRVTVNGTRAIAVWRRGEMLRFGNHPMAPFIFSSFDGLKTLEWLRVELQITHDDERRLRNEMLTDKRFQGLPAATPPDIKFINSALLDVVALLPKSLREQLTPAFG